VSKKFATLFELVDEMVLSECHEALCIWFRDCVPKFGLSRVQVVDGE
jgi:hypothetical protein